MKKLLNSMNIGKIRYMALFAAAMTALSSCSVYNSVTEKLFGKKTETVKQATLPTDRVEILRHHEDKAYTVDEISRGVIRGDWAIEEVQGRKAVGQTSPYLKFAEKTQKVYGNNGCNIINADYKYNTSDTTLRFSNVISTMMLCDVTGITDIEINQALDLTRKYSWELRGTEYWLYFYDSSNRRIMSLMHQNFEFLNGTWRVAAIDNEAISDNEMLLVIDIAEGKVHGNTGCNILNGTITTDMDAPNSISFQEIATTRMACPDDSHETDLLVALEDAAFAKPLSPTRVQLLDNRNNVVLTLERK